MLHRQTRSRSRSLPNQRLRAFSSTAPLTVDLLDGLLAFWNLDEGTMDNRLDATGNGNTLIPTGTVDNDPSGLIGGMAVMSSGASLTRTASLFTTAPFSIACWVQVQEFGIDQILFAQGTTSANRQYLGVNSSDAIILASGSDLLTSSASITGNWQHLVWTCDGTTNRLYSDGSLVASGGASPNFTGVDRFAWGAGFNPVNGGNIWLDLCGAWSRAINALEVAELYNSGAGYSPF